MTLALGLERGNGITATQFRWDDVLVKHSVDDTLRCAQGADEGVAEQLSDEEGERTQESDSDAEGNAAAKKRKRRKKLKSHLRTESSKKTTGAFFRDLL